MSIILLLERKHGCRRESFSAFASTFSSAMVRKLSLTMFIMACVWHPRLQFESLSLSALCPFTPQQWDIFRLSFPILADGSGESKAQSSTSEQDNFSGTLKCTVSVYHFVLVKSNTLWSLYAAYFQSRQELSLSLSLSEF